MAIKIKPQRLLRVGTTLYKQFEAAAAESTSGAVAMASEAASEACPDVSEGTAAPMTLCTTQSVFHSQSVSLGTHTDRGGLESSPEASRVSGRPLTVVAVAATPAHPHLPSALSESDAQSFEQRDPLTGFLVDPVSNQHIASQSGTHPAAKDSEIGTAHQSADAAHPMMRCIGNPSTAVQISEKVPLLTFSGPSITVQDLLPTHPTLDIRRPRCGSSSSSPSARSSLHFAHSGEGIPALNKAAHTALPPLRTHATTNNAGISDSSGRLNHVGSETGMEQSTTGNLTPVAAPTSCHKSHHSLLSDSLLQQPQHAVLQILPGGYSTPRKDRWSPFHGIADVAAVLDPNHGSTSLPRGAATFVLTDSCDHLPARAQQHATASSSLAPVTTTPCSDRHSSLQANPTCSPIPCGSRDRGGSSCVGQAGTHSEALSGRGPALAACSNSGPEQQPPQRQHGHMVLQMGWMGAEGDPDVRRSGGDGVHDCHGGAATPLPQSKTSNTAAAVVTSTAARVTVDVEGYHDDNGEDLCMICYDNPPACVFMSCGHGGFCKQCANLLFLRPPNECPTCRAPLEQVCGRLGGGQKKLASARFDAKVVQDRIHIASDAVLLNHDWLYSVNTCTVLCFERSPPPKQCLNS